MTGQASGEEAAMSTDVSRASRAASSAPSSTTSEGPDPREHSEPHSEPGTPALKEWAAVCRAILTGQQIITLRKGGIREERRRFEVPFETFVLYPTYAHQEPELLKPAYARWATGSERTPRAAVEVSGLCRVAEIFKIADEAALEALDSWHVWRRDYVLERLKWKPRQPLWVVALRAYLLDSPAIVEHKDAYEGCKSWIALECAIDLEAQPVLDDRTFESKLTSLREVLEPFALRDQE